MIVAAGDTVDLMGLDVDITLVGNCQAPVTDCFPNYSGDHLTSFWRISTCQIITILITITLPLNSLLSYLSALPSFHTDAVNLNTEIMTALCHNMTFGLPPITTTLKITSVLKPEGCRPLRSCHHPSHSFPTTLVPVSFYYPATVLDPLSSAFLFSPSRADTLTLTSSVPSDLPNPVVYSAIDAPGFDARRRNNISFSRFGSSSRPFVS